MLKLLMSIVMIVNVSSSAFGATTGCPAGCAECVMGVCTKAGMSAKGIQNLSGSKVEANHSVSGGGCPAGCAECVMGICTKAGSQ